jgi:hypothetical protein
MRGKFETKRGLENDFERFSYQVRKDGPEKEGRLDGALHAHAYGSTNKIVGDKVCH